jgi:hypothetical protein
LDENGTGNQSGMDENMELNTASPEFDDSEDTESHMQPERLEYFGEEVCCDKSIFLFSIENLA